MLIYSLVIFICLFTTLGAPTKSSYSNEVQSSTSKILLDGTKNLTTSEVDDTSTTRYNSSTLGTTNFPKNTTNTPKNDVLSETTTKNSTSTKKTAENSASSSKAPKTIATIKTSTHATSEKPKTTSKSSIVSKATTAIELTRVPRASDSKTTKKPASDVPKATTKEPKTTTKKSKPKPTTAAPTDCGSGSGSGSGDGTNYELDPMAGEYSDSSAKSRKKRSPSYDYSADALGANDLGSGSGSGSGCPTDYGGGGSGGSSSGNGDGGTEVGDYGFGSGADDPTVDTEAGKKMAFGVLMVISLVFILMQIWTSIFGHKMEMHPIRWHTIHYNAWNVVQLVMFANNEKSSPWKGYLHDEGIEMGETNLLKLTFSTFMSSMAFITPFILISYYLPSIFKTPITKWMIWIPIYGILNIIPIVFCFAWYRVPCEQKEEQEFFKGSTMVMYFMKMFPDLITALMNWALANNILMDLMNFYNMILSQSAWCALMLPIAEFLATILGIEMYREQYIWILSCGRFFNDPPCDATKKKPTFTTVQPIQQILTIQQPKASVGSMISASNVNATMAAPRNGGWTDPVLQSALNTDPNKRFIPVTNVVQSTTDMTKKID